MAQEVFKAAGDPNVFPDQIKAGLLPWTPLKVYARVPSFSISPKGMYDYATGKWAPVRFYDYVSGKWTDAVPTTTLKISEGAYDPALGESYIQLGARRPGPAKIPKRRNRHPPLREPSTSPITATARASPRPNTEKSFFDGIDISLTGIAALAPGQHPFLTEGLRQIAASVDQATRQPDKITPLAAGLKQTQLLIQKVEASNLSAEQKYNINHELEVKQAQFNSALIEALGVTLTAVVAPANPDRGRSGFAIDAQDTFTTAVPGLSFGVSAYLTNPSKVPVQIQSMSLHSTGAGDWHITNHQPAPRRSPGQPAPDRSIPRHRPGRRHPHPSLFPSQRPGAVLLRPRQRQLPRSPAPALSSGSLARIHGRRSHRPHRPGGTNRAARRSASEASTNPWWSRPGISVAATATAGIVPLGQTEAGQPSMFVYAPTSAARLRPNSISICRQGWQSQPDNRAFAEAQTINVRCHPAEPGGRSLPHHPGGHLPGSHVYAGI